MKISSTNINTLTTADVQDAKLRKACQDFEAVLIKQMLSKMRDTVPENDLFGSSEEEKIFQEMMDQETAVQIARKGCTGIAEILYRQLAGDV